MAITGSTTTTSSSTISPLVRSKILKPAGASIEPLERKVAESFVDLESHSADLRHDMKSLHFYSVQEIETSSGRKAIVISIPVPLLKSYRKIGSKLVRELEKKFSDKHVILIARRKITPKAKKGSHMASKVRLRNRTLTAVQEAMLDDIVSPVEISGKRTRVRRDGSRLLKVLLDAKDRNAVEYKLDTFTSVYRHLTGKQVCFEFEN